MDLPTIIAFVLLCASSLQTDAQKEAALAKVPEQGFVTIYGLGNGGRRVRLIREGKSQVIDLKVLRQDPTKDIHLQPGDVLVIPETVF